MFSERYWSLWCVTTYDRYMWKNYLNFEIAMITAWLVRYCDIPLIIIYIHANFKQKEKKWKSCDRIVASTHWYNHACTCVSLVVFVTCILVILKNLEYNTRVRRTNVFREVWLCRMQYHRKLLNINIKKCHTKSRTWFRERCQNFSLSTFMLRLLDIWFDTFKLTPLIHLHYCSSII